MSTTSIGPRALAAVAATLATTVALLAALAPPAQAAMIYACVKKRTGAVRIVARTTRCRRGESRQSWNTTGPAGANGANGTNGTNGANGAVAGYTATSEGMELQPEKETVVLTKAIPAGSYLVSAKVTMVGEGSAKGQLLEAACVLTDSPGPAFVKAGPSVDTAVWLMALVENEASFSGILSEPLMGAVSNPAASPLSIVCIDAASTSKGVKVLALEPVIDAVQTSHNG